MKQYIQKIQNQIHLTQSEIEDVMANIMEGTAPAKDVADFLMALREKGPSVDEITGAARIMRRFVLKVKTKHKDVLDTCGTGGDKKNTFNISTCVAFVVAGVGGIVAKHGNRSVSSRCGSADILEALGIKLDLTPEQIGQCLDEVGIAFLFAQKLHPSMKNVAPIRKELGVETIFNILGPLTNPAGATHQLIGVYSRDYVEPIANVLKNLGSKRVLVVHGHDGLDEITTTGQTFLSEFDGKEIRSYDITPDELDIALAQEKDLLGGDLKENVRIFEQVLEGEKGPKRDIVVVNAAYALYVAEQAESISDAMTLAKESIDAGHAMNKLIELKEFTRRV